jgi:DNA-binding transcriptional LysR family regulator
MANQGIGRFTETNVKSALARKQLQPILQECDWGDYFLYALYPQQEALPSRTRLLLEMIADSFAS